MAAQDALKEVGGQLVEKIFSGMLWFGIGAIIAITVGSLIWWFGIYKKKFNIKVKVISERANDKNVILFDQAAILKDRNDGSHFFRLWSLKLDLPAPKFNVLQSTDKGDYLELYRTSENRIYYLTPSIVDKTKIIRSDGKVYAIASQITKQIDPEMDFWLTKRKKLNRGMFATDSIFMKILPLLPALMGGVFMIFMLYILMDHLPGILSQLTQLVREMKTLKGAEITTSLAFLRWKIK